MEYNTKFIKNLTVKENNAGTERVTITIHDYERDSTATTGVKDNPIELKVNTFPNLIKRYNIQPGVIASYDKKYYSILDRNLKDGITYKDKAETHVNILGFSFNRIDCFENNDSYNYTTNLNRFCAKDDAGNTLTRFPVVSEVSLGGSIYDVFKLPWNIPAIRDFGVISGFTDLFNPREKENYIGDTDFESPASFSETWKLNKNLIGSNLNKYLINKYVSFLLLGVSALKINPIDQYSVILTLWHKWIDILKSIYIDPMHWEKSYDQEKGRKVHSKCNTFEQFVNLVISKWDADKSTGEYKIIDLTTDLFSDAGILYLSTADMKMIKDSTHYVNNNIKITEVNGKSTTRKHYLWFNNAPHDIKIYIKDKEHSIDPHILGMFNKKDELCVFDGVYNDSVGTHIRKVFISNFGDVALKNLGSNLIAAAYVLFDVTSLPSVKKAIEENKSYIINPYMYLYAPYSYCTGFDEYDVGIIASNINYNVISNYDSSKKLLYTYRKIEIAGKRSISIYQLDGTSIIGKTSEDISNELDKLIEEEVYVTPDEYYSNFVTIGEYSSGDTGFVRVKTDTDEDDIPKWFWSDTLKNWCIYKEAPLRNTIKLYVWNGKNNWDDFEDVLKNPDAFLYDISHLKFGINFSTTYRYQNLVITYKSVIMTYDNDFSQYTRDTYQTLRIGKMWSKGLDKETNRYPFSIGLPPVMRLASGEIALMYYLTLPGLDKDHPLIYSEHLRFINDVCRNYFGAGDDKTIEDDWKRVEKAKIKLDTASIIESMAESTVVDADEINTVEDSADETKLLFVPFKQYIETDNIETEGYVERWS